MVATSSNRRQLSAVLETTLGTTPITPRMRQKVVVSESLKYTPTFDDSAEMRSDRMTSDSILTGINSSGATPWEMHYPYPDSCADFDIRSAFFNNWALTPVRDNDTVAGAVITSLSATALVCTTGPAFVVGHLVRTTGFALAANNKVVAVTTGGTTGYTATAAGYTIDAAPAAAARAKVVGFTGVAGDITATATGLAATTLNFTTLGLAVGQWIKVGGTASTDRFTTVPAVNGRARITAIAAAALSLDNLPTGWGVDSGAGKTIKVWFGDRIFNGVTVISQSIERGDLGMVTPVYMLQPGLIAAQWSLSVKPKQIITGTTTYMGMGGGTVSTTTIDAVIDAAPAQSVFPQFAGSANVGRISENGNALTTPNWCTGLDLTIANNLSPVETIDLLGPQDLVPGECLVTGTLNTIFGDSSILTRFFAGTQTSLNLAFARGVQMVFLTMPRVTLNGDGSPNAGGKNQIIDVNFGFRASKDDALTNTIISLDRLEYFET